MKKSIAVFALVTFLVAFIGVGLAMAKKGTPPLTCEIEYFFTGHLGILDSEGRLFCWAGPISGDIEGIMKWWAVLPPSSTGQVSHYEFRWEVWDEEWISDMESWDGEDWDNWDNGERVLSLAGDEEERTIFRHGKNSVWRANGIVAEASEEYEDYLGSQMHEGGNFTWAAPGLPDQGAGTFRVAGSSSKAAPGKQSTGKSAISWGNIKAGK